MGDSPRKGLQVGLTEASECPFSIPAKQDEVRTLEFDNQLDVMRAKGSLCPAKMPFGSLNNGLGWVASQHQAVKNVLKDNRFSIAYQLTGDYPRARVAEVGDPFPHSFIDMDPPEHTNHRRVLMKHMTPSRVNGLRQFTADYVDACIDHVFAFGPGADLKAMITQKVPLAILRELLGVSSGEQFDFSQQAHDFVSQRHANAQETAAALDIVKDYFKRLVAEKENNPGDDLLSALIHDVEVKGSWTREELDNVGTILLIGGFDSSAGFLASMVNWLVHDPAVFQMLKDDESLVTPAMEEFLRLLPVGVPGTRTRIATQDVTLGDTTVKKGQSVLAIPHAANMDPDFFEDPYEFRLDRPKGPSHIAFGFGAHLCPGSPLARMDIETVMRGILKRFDRLEPFVANANWKQESLMRGPRTIQVKWSA